MKFASILISLLQLFVVSMAYSLSEGTISVGDQIVQFGEINTQEIKQLTIDVPKDKIEIQLKLAESLKDRPHHVVITLGDNKDLTHSYVPNFVPSSQLLKLTIPVGKIPSILKLKEKLFLNLIVSDSNPKQKNLLKSLVEIIPTENLQSTIQYAQPDTLGPKPEIHHIFKTEEATANPIIPLTFSAVAVVLTLGLYIGWNIFLSGNLFATSKHNSYLEAIQTFGFLASITGFEVTFIRYYLGDSIFKTLARSFLLGLPAIFFGSKVLSKLSIQRKVGKA